MLPVIAVIEYCVILLEHTLSGPDITGAGVGMILMFLEMVLSQPKFEVCFTVTVPVPVTPQWILTVLLEFEPMINPPVAVHW